jgi:hypothetical protein
LLSGQSRYGKKSAIALSHWPVAVLAVRQLGLYGAVGNGRVGATGRRKDDCQDRQVDELQNPAPTLQWSSPWAKIPIWVDEFHDLDQMEGITRGN